MEYAVGQRVIVHVPSCGELPGVVVSVDGGLYRVQPLHPAYEPGFCVRVPATAVRLPWDFAPQERGRADPRLSTTALAAVPERHQYPDGKT